MFPLLDLFFKIYTSFSLFMYICMHKNEEKEREEDEDPPGLMVFLLAFLLSPSQRRTY